jgi:hypothetical protein
MSCRFAPSNLFAVTADGAVKHLSSEKALKEFFRTHLPPVLSDADAKSAVQAWLRMAEELYQDGYFAFKIEQDSLGVQSRDGKRVAPGRARVTEGGEGQISATLTFDRKGKLVNTSTEAALKPGGARPAGARP